MEPAFATSSGISPTLDRFARAEIHAPAIDRDGRVPRRVLAGLRELGLFGISIPEAYGGSGLGLAGLCEAIATLARHDRSVATTIGLHGGLGTRGLVAFGSEALKERYLPRLASGEAIAAFATTEGGAGSDLAAIQTSASLESGRVRLRGSKVFVTNGGLADVFTVTAASAGPGQPRRGQSLILLERTDRGLEVLREERKLGLRGSSTTGLRFEDVELPPERIIGAPGGAKEHLPHVLAWGRTAMAAGCVGAARAALEKTLDHVADRRQFGQPLASLEVVRAQLAEAGALLRAMEAIVHDAAAAEDQPTLLASRSVAAKVFCSEGNWRICDLAVQLHGGSGYIEDTGLPLLLRDARITRIFEGANDVLLTHLGGLEACAEPRVLRRAQPERGPLVALVDEIDGHRRELTTRLGVRLMGRSRELHRLGELAVLRAVAEALQTEADHPLALHWLRRARVRARELFEAPAPLEEIDAAVGALEGRLHR